MRECISPAVQGTDSIKQGGQTSYGVVSELCRAKGGEHTFSSSNAYVLKNSFRLVKVHTQQSSYKSRQGGFNATPRIYKLS